MKAMTHRLVDTGWASELVDSLRLDRSELRIACPFIKAPALDELLALKPARIRVITRYNLSDFADGASDITALRKLLEAGAAVRGIRNLHAKLYVFGDARAIVTSANLTEAGLRRNHEFGIVIDWVKRRPRYFRVHHAEFIAGTLANDVSLNKLMDELKADSFASTQENTARGEGNTDPRRAYQQQSRVRLSTDGLAWLNEQLQAAFDAHGTISHRELDKLDQFDVLTDSLSS